MLGIALHAGVSFPVGKVDFLKLYPLTFEEFLLASKKDLAAEALNKKDWDTLKSLSTMFVELLRQYYYVGGMPAVVSAFLEGSGPAEVRKIQKQILADYENDFSKHAPPHEHARIKMIWDSIPRQLSKENKKFLYSALKKGERASKYELALQWLLDAGITILESGSSKKSNPFFCWLTLHPFPRRPYSFPMACRRWTHRDRTLQSLRQRPCPFPIP